MKYTQVEARLRRVLGNESVDQLLDYCFEYTTKEASFLQLRSSCTDEIQYMKAFADLCKLRRRSFMDQLYETIIDLAEEYKILPSSLAERFTVEPASYAGIEAMIHKRYYPRRNI